MILPTVPDNYTRASGYPKISNNEGADTVTDKLYIAFESFERTEIERLQNLSYWDLPVNNLNIEVDEAQHKIYVTLQYGLPNAANGLTAAFDGVDEWTLDDSGAEVPIEKKKQDGSHFFSSYRTNHNYCLVANNKTTSNDDTPDFWSTAKDTKILKTNEDKYKWVKDEAPDGWHEIKSKTKNIEAVLMPSAVVVGTAKFGNYDAAVSHAKVTGTKATPGKTFGRSGEWLIVGSSISKDGRRWVVTTRYQNAPEWDDDYY